MAARRHQHIIFSNMLQHLLQTYFCHKNRNFRNTFIHASEIHHSFLLKAAKPSAYILANASLSCSVFLFLIPSVDEVGSIPDRAGVLQQRII